jgi:hypothetical protein
MNPQEVTLYKEEKYKRNIQVSFFKSPLPAKMKWPTNGTTGGRRAADDLMVTGVRKKWQSQTVRDAGKLRRSRLYISEHD